ncbi:cytochrome-c peroxidase [Tenacibaculum aiptasiae]|uniref:Methylamine utilization protein MauG n=1 Tax=Tenacibaculum aiptasiae TaxID=426481 RepID=A0A7J5A6Z5_9FLAO|nr:cytochrome c peroxidase [Tenacibaculum aiptasiae]KAB1153305.1 cytochrome-c peroxidase [Tenacibaculum aiptasiae]
MRYSIIALIIFNLLVSCKQQKSEYQALQDIYKKKPSEWVKPWVDSTVTWKELGVLPKPNYPNNEKPSKELLQLGKQLFFDSRLSQTKQFACVSCHHPIQNYTDNREKSLGFMLKEGNRNAPTVLNLSYNKHFFWDGRAASLEEQALGPFQNPVEMNTHLDTVVSRVKSIKGYRKVFKNIFNKEDIIIEDIAYAIAMFERSLISRKSKFDNFLLGKKELDENELKGLHLFRTKGRCLTCHNGPLFTDNKFHNLGLTYYGRKFEDLGRYNITKKKEDVGKFKTPSLRDVMRTGPWMHNGLFGKMDGILNMYSNGMPRPRRREHQKNDSLFPTTSPLIQKLDLTEEEKENIIAFLESLSAPAFRISTPELPKE